MKLLKILSILILFSSCTTQRRCLRKFPPQTLIERSDSIIYRDTIIYHDRVIRDTIRPDTVFKERVIEVPKELVILPIEAENDYARAKAWIEAQRLRLELTQKEQVIERIIKNAESHTTYWKEKYQTERRVEVHTEYKVRKIHKIALWFSGITLLLLILYIANKVKKVPSVLVLFLLSLNIFRAK